jgi:hypothetical protein
VRAVESLHHLLHEVLWELEAQRQTASSGGAMSSAQRGTACEAPDDGGELQVCLRSVV